ncbi:hypothetical protein PGT21_001635 [Puccinia graminis f. sp. tritici]|uniref:Uncharacterized protein n=1 Tax=Puccinia graminis f. sp. tritici TaxID=56615 RepID=A0A5B0M1K5_PUCGR|nr:hypothetical protein PGTUg99_008049 [Puccinia graminis f. sp. tritici]KAA1071263.1 hypothetical protein PGT21_001635 [Puccinia graminis f. sp. tritici]
MKAFAFLSGLDQLLLAFWSAAVRSLALKISPFEPEGIGTGANQRILILKIVPLPARDIQPISSFRICMSTGYDREVPIRFPTVMEADDCGIWDRHKFVDQKIKLLEFDFGSTVGKGYLFYLSVSHFRAPERNAKPDRSIQSIVPFPPATQERHDGSHFS